MAMTAADAGEKLLYSPDGQGWQETASSPFGQDHGVFTERQAAGWFVVATSAPQASSPESVAPSPAAGCPYPARSKAKKRKKRRR